MKNLIVFALVVFVVSIGGGQGTFVDTNLNEIFNKKYQHKMISSGDNFPDFNVRKKKMDLILIALHEDVPLKEIQSKVEISHEEMDSIIQLLTSKSWLHKINGQYKPQVFIATNEDGKLLYEYARPISSKIVARIQEQLPEIQDQFEHTQLSNQYAFEDWAFLILSNVLLDNWQINHVEKQFLGKSARPVRHGKNYYAAILESNTDRESFGIYGNQFGQVSVYGNNRKKADLSARNYVVSKSDGAVFIQMADDFSVDLLKILDEFKPYCYEVYEKTGYSEEITFEEFFIWWYHFIYTQATDLMAEMNLLKVPESGNFVYSIE